MTTAQHLRLLFENLKCFWRPGVRQRSLCASASLRETFRHGAGTRRATLSDNSRRHFVDHDMSFAREITSFRRPSADNSSANCRLGASSRPDGISQFTSRQRLATRPKKHARTKRKKPRAPAAVVVSSQQEDRQNAFADIGHWDFVVGHFPTPTPIYLVAFGNHVSSSEKQATFLPAPLSPSENCHLRKTLCYYP